METTYQKDFKKFMDTIPGAGSDDVRPQDLRPNDCVCVFNFGGGTKKGQGAIFGRVVTASETAVRMTFVAGVEDGKWWEDSGEPEGILPVAKGDTFLRLRLD
jgi:hypothetical protein